MKRLIDTSAWIEWLIGSNLGAEIADLLPENGQWIVPTMVQLELSKWLTREVGADKARDVMAFCDKLVVMPLTTVLAISAAEHCRVHKLATADAVIYATALACDAELLTCDHHFQSLPSVRYLPKRAG